MMSGSWIGRCRPVAAYRALENRTFADFAVRSHKRSFANALRLASCARRLGADLIAPGVFGTVDRFVGAGENFVQSWRRACCAGSAHADGYRHGRDAFPNADWLRLDLAPHALGRDQRLSHRRIRQQDNKLLTTKACHEIDRTHTLREPRGKRLEAGIAGEMSMLVINHLEVVDVDHEQRWRRPDAVCARHLVCEALDEFAPVSEARERAAPRELLQRTPSALKNLPAALTPAALFLVTNPPPTLTPRLT